MNIALLALVIDVMAIGLLAAVIVYAVRLNKYFNMLRSGKEELARQLTSFADSTRRAEDAIAKMKVSTEENAMLLDQQIRRAELVRRDLSRSSGDEGPSPLSGKSRREGASSGSRAGVGGTRARRTVSPAPTAMKAEEGGGASARERVLSRRRRTEEVAEGDEGRGSDEDVGSRQRSKSKTELLKALQGMR